MISISPLGYGAKKKIGKPVWVCLFISDCPLKKIFKLKNENITKKKGPREKEKNRAVAAALTF